MSSPASRTLPSTLAPGTSSWSRLRQRMKVDLPHPEGPITAWVVSGSSSRVMSSSAWRVPYQAERALTSTCAHMVTSSCPLAGEPPGAKGQQQDQDDQGERGGPGALVGGGVGGGRAPEDLQRQRRDRTVQARRDELVAERGEQKRRAPRPASPRW